MEHHNERIINGLLKADIEDLTPEEVDARLAADVSIIVDKERAIPGDLWPCIWFLASAIERQFTGKVRIYAGLDRMPPAPVPLGPRCEIQSDEPICGGIRILLGDFPAGLGEGIEIRGDARGNEISCGVPLKTYDPAHPISSCALAGYLAFSALARAIGIPPHHESWTQKSIRLVFAPSRKAPPSFSVLGVGQVGQAFLSLAYFLAGGQEVAVHLLDKDTFEDCNQRTQVLLEEAAVALWRGKPKTEYIAALCRSWGWAANGERCEIKWGWRPSQSPSEFALLGFDNMDARRIAAEGGFQWLFECGVGTDFCRPHVSWHSFPPSRDLAKAIFREPKIAVATSQFAKTLGDGPGECGRVIFEGVQATAPSLGLVAVAMAWGEAMSANGPAPISGGAFLWSPLLPLQRDILYT